MIPGTGWRRVRVLIAVMACILICVAAATLLFGRSPDRPTASVPGDPATMSDADLARYLRDALDGRSVPVTTVTVTGEGTDARKAQIELEVKSARAVNPVLEQIMGNITDVVATLVDERHVDLDFYAVLLRDRGGVMLLDLQVDINNKSSHWRRDPRLIPLGAPPSILKRYGK